MLLPNTDWRSLDEYDGEHTPQGETLEPDEMGDVQPEDIDFDPDPEEAPF